VDASERLSANERRKLKSTDLPAQKKVRINDTELLAQFMDLKNDLEDRTGKYSTQATLEYALRLEISTVLSRHSGLLRTIKSRCLSLPWVCPGGDGEKHILLQVFGLNKQ